MAILAETIMTTQQELEYNYQVLKNNIDKIINTLDITHNVSLIAVSKTFTGNAIRQIFAMGQTNFAENYVQEFVHKVDELSDLAIIWHFIGKIQSNKIKAIAQHTHWVHGLDQVKHTLLLNKHRPTNMPKLNVLIEVNLSGNLSRHGVTTLQEIKDLADIIRQQPNLMLRGLMGIASNTQDSALIAQQFEQLHSLYTSIQLLYSNIDTLSMGMSGDYQLALHHGTTMLRIGSLIFGNRTSITYL